MKWIKAAVFMGTLTLVLLAFGVRKLDREELKKLMALKEKEEAT
jgi:hypothetical protein